MKLFLLLALSGLGLSMSPVAARTEYRLGGDDGNPWPDALSEGPAGEYVVLDGEGQVVRTAPVGTTPYGEGTESMVDYVGISIQPLFIEPGVNLVLSDFSAGATNIPLPYTEGYVSTAWYCWSLGADLMLMRPFFDGDPTTGTFLKGGERPTRAYPLVNFGAAIPINRIRFYPRLGQRDDLQLIEAMAEPRHPVEAFGQDSFSKSILTGYEIRTADSSVDIYTKSPCDKLPHGSHSRNYNWPTPTDPRFDLLKKTEENLDAVVELTFPTRYVQWLTFSPITNADWEAAEFEIYGEGFAQELLLRTQILDMGQPVNWGRVHWRGEFPPGTRMEIRTRTGNTEDTNLYFGRDANGNVIPVTLAVYNDINWTEQIAPVYDVDNWTFWSPSYAAVDGDLGVPIGYPIFMSFAIIVGNVHGFRTGEWKGASRQSIAWIMAGIALLIIGVCILATGKTLAPAKPPADSQPAVEEAAAAELIREVKVSSVRCS